MKSLFWVSPVPSTVAKHTHTCSVSIGRKNNSWMTIDLRVDASHAFQQNNLLLCLPLEGDVS